MHIPIPIGMVPSRETSNLATEPEALPVEPSKRKRDAVDLQLWEPGDDDDEALLLAAAEAELSPVTAQNTTQAVLESRTGDGLSEGVMQALAKLRERG